MKTKIICTDDEFIICARRLPVLTRIISATTILFVIGILILYHGLVNEEYFCLIIPGLPVFILALIGLIDIPRQIKKMKVYGGAVLLKINRRGISVASIPGQNPYQHRWSNIFKIALTEKYIHVYKWLNRGGRHRTYYREEKDLNKLTETSRDKIIIFLRRNKKPGSGGVLKSPEGTNFLRVSSPAGELMRIKTELQRFSNNKVEIQIVSGIIFNDVEQTERFIPLGPLSPLN